MPSTFKPFVLPACAVLLFVLWLTALAYAQSTPGPLPTAPGADRAVEGGLSMSHASLPGGPGKSPLEPYLVTWLLPVSGLLALFAGIYTDRRIRSMARLAR